MPRIKNLNVYIVAILSAFLFLMCQSTVPAKSAQPVEPQKTKKTDDMDPSVVALRPEKLVGSSGTVSKTKPMGNEPGTNERYNRPVGAPPMVPHAINDFIPIKMGLNDCLACHTKPSKYWTAKGVPLLSDFHRKDRNGKRVLNKRGIYMGFFNCTTCHNVMTDAKPLVENTFSQP